MSNEQKLCKSFFIYFSTMTQFACQCLWDEYLCCFYSFLAVISFVQPYGVWIFFFRIIASIFTEHGFVSFGCAALVIVASRHNQNREQFTLFVSVCINLSQETNQRVSTGPTRNHLKGERKWIRKSVSGGVNRIPQQHLILNFGEPRWINMQVVLKKSSLCNLLQNSYLCIKLQNYNFFNTRRTFIRRGLPTKFKLNI